MEISGFYWAAVNVLAFVLFGADKRRAVKKQFRIPERILLGSAVLGGSAGALAGMLYFRHKTKKKVFRIGIPLVLFLQVVMVIGLLKVYFT